MNYDIPFVPSSDEKIQIILEMASVYPDIKTVDLGSGNGKVVIAFAKAGAEAYGFEIDPGRVRVSRNLIKQEGVSNRAHIYEGSFWDADIGTYDVITVFGITAVMQRLEEKLKREMKPKAIVLSNLFPFPSWVPLNRRNNVYEYMKL